MRGISKNFPMVLAAMFWCSADKVQAETLVGPSGKPMHRVKCNMSPTGCYQQATEACRSKSYQVLDSESRRGGLIADIIPGPVTWYSMTFQCGKSDGRLPDFPFRDMRSVPQYVPPPIQAPNQPSFTTCSRIGNSVACTSN